jgi:putative endonuclease
MKRWIQQRLGGGAPSKIEIGRRGEDLAAKELRRRGYRIRERNFRCSLGEIDILDEDGEEIVIVEVKTRSAGAHADPQDSVTPAKAARLIQLSCAYLARPELDDADWRIDVVAVRTDRTGGATVEIIRGAVSE